MDEEVKLRVGLDSKPAEQGFRRLKDTSQETGESTHKSFLHASNGARQFHQLLHEVTATSPVMGRALQIALSPISGLFAAATAGVALLNDKLKESKQEFDRMGREAAEPVFDIKRATHEATIELNEFRERYAKWAKGKEHDEVIEKLEDQLRILHELGSAAQKVNIPSAPTGVSGPGGAAGLPGETGGTGLDEVKQRQIEWLLNVRAMKAAVGRYAPLGDDVKAAKDENESLIRRTAIKEAETTILKQEEKMAAAKLKLASIQDSQHPWYFDVGGKLFDMANPDLAFVKNWWEKHQKNKAGELQSEMDGYQKRIDEARVTIEQETAARRKAADKLQEAQGRYDANVQAFDKLTHSVDEARVNLIAAAQRRNTAPLTGEMVPGTPTPQQEAVSAYLAGTQRELSDYNNSVANKINDWNRREHNPYFRQLDRLGFDPNANSAGSVRGLEQKLDSILQQLQSGIPIKIPDDSGGASATK